MFRPSTRATDLIRSTVPRSLRNFLRRPLATMRWIGNDLMALVGRSSRVRIQPDWEITCHPESANIFTITTEIEETRAELQGFIERCKPGMVFADVGAHFGIFSLAAVRYGGRDSLVYAVEPSKVPFRILRENVRLAHADAQVQLLDVAVGPSDGVLAMLTTGAGDWHMLVAADQPRPDATEAHQLTLGTLFSRMPRPPTHLKMDIEGFEAEAIEGGLDALKAHRPLFFLELHGEILRRRGRDPAVILAQLAACGYTSFEVGGHARTPREIAALDNARIICS